MLHNRVHTMGWLSRLRSTFFSRSTSGWYKLLRRSIYIAIVDHSSFPLPVTFNQIWLTIGIICIGIFLQCVWGLWLLFPVIRIGLIVPIIRLSASGVHAISWACCFLKVFAGSSTIIFWVVALSITWRLYFGWSRWIFLCANSTVAFYAWANSTMTLSSGLIGIIPLVWWLPISAFILIMSSMRLICSIQIRVTIQVRVGSHTWRFLDLARSQFFKISNTRF